MAQASGHGDPPRPISSQEGAAGFTIISARLAPPGVWWWARPGDYAAADQGTGEAEGGTGPADKWYRRQLAEMDHRLAGIVQLGENRACHQSAPCSWTRRLAQASPSVSTNRQRPGQKGQEKKELIDLIPGCSGGGQPAPARHRPAGRRSGGPPICHQTHVAGRWITGIVLYQREMLPQSRPQFSPTPRARGPLCHHCQPYPASRETARARDRESPGHWSPCRPRKSIGNVCLEQAKPRPTPHMAPISTNCTNQQGADRILRVRICAKSSPARASWRSAPVLC